MKTGSHRVVAVRGDRGWSQCVMCFRTAAAQNAARSHVLNMGVVVVRRPAVYDPGRVYLPLLIAAARRLRSGDPRWRDCRRGPVRRSAVR